MSSQLISTNEEFAKLWRQAVDDYIVLACLSKAEEAALKGWNSLEEAFNLTKHGWERNLSKRHLA
jgi:hypothetical protein